MAGLLIVAQSIKSTTKKDAEPAGYQLTSKYEGRSVWSGLELKTFLASWNLRAA
jgi:hypothetical protein